MFNNVQISVFHLTASTSVVGALEDCFEIQLSGLLCKDTLTAAGQCMRSEEYMDRISQADRWHTNRECRAMLVSRAEGCWDWHLKYFYHDAIPTTRSNVSDVLLFLLLSYDGVELDFVDCLIMNTW